MPVWTSSLLLVAELEAALPAGRRVGVVTADAASLDRRCTWRPSAPPTTRRSRACARFARSARTLLEDRAELDADEAERRPSPRPCG